MNNPLVHTSCRAPGLAEFYGRHAGETIIVCGCGASLNELKDPGRFITIGVNDVGRRFQPNYLVVLNPRGQFAGDRFRYIESSRAEYVFSQLNDLRIPSAPIVRIRLGRYGGADFSDPDVLHYTQNSPYLALCLAVHMGSRRIGLIGVDFTENHFFAQTGKHVLSRKIDQINREYAALGQACKELGIEIINLSQQSLLTAFPKRSVEDFSTSHPPHAVDKEESIDQTRRVFFVNYRFLSCGDVFSDGLRNAGRELGLQHADACWDDPQLPAKVRAFNPDLLFVVHGRKFVRRWKDAFRSYNSAVWLLDEPYEVDDTAGWSAHFHTVYVNDPGTISRHHNAHYLPVAYDPRTYHAISGPKEYSVGFIGGYNQSREAALLKLAEHDLLSYVVGGPWKSHQLQTLSLSGNVPARKTADLYQKTRLVVNVFRDIHHFNRKSVPAWSLNPRVYEALACGALVVSAPRPEIDQVIPELPVFGNVDGLAELVRELLADEAELDRRLYCCREKVAGHTYASRLKFVICTSIAAFPVNRNSHAHHEMPVIIPCRTGSAAGPAREGSLRVNRAAQSSKGGNNGNNPVSAIAPAKTRNLQRIHPIKPLPFTEMPRRNLIYHIWPVKGSMWRYNLNQIKDRIDVFNGRRIVAIVYDDKSEDPECVKELLKDHGCEFIIEPNDKSGECLTFPRMLRAVSSLDPNEVTFYAHAKGVKYEPNVPWAIRQWVEVQYRACLDNWLKVVQELEQYSLTGPFKRLGRYQTHQMLGDWHYTGTFFWLRHAQVFNRDCLAVPEFYGGVEAWPGIYFRENEAGCLFLNTGAQAPYYPRFWESCGNAALKRWESSVKLAPVPSDLARPLPYDGYESPRTEQKPDELNWWIHLLLQADVRRLLTIGAGAGGVEWHIARVFRRQQRDIEITAVDLNPDLNLQHSLQDARENFGQSIKLVKGDSSSEAVHRELLDRYDAVFIDSDHSYRGARNDWLLAGGLRARFAAFHDIVDSHWHVQNRCCVSRLWSELKAKHKTDQRSGEDWGGIGVVQLD